jgi:Ca-activated chloride channel family protein
MNEKLHLKHLFWWGRIVLLFVFVLVLLIGTLRDRNFWSSADHRGDALFRRGKFEEAAKIYTDPMRQGIAFYRAGDFEKAAKAFVRAPGAAGAFNQGDALLMHGAYDQAINAFDRALGFHPGWIEAEENRALAMVRRDRIKKPAGEAGAEQEPDQTVINLNAKPTGQKPDQSAGGDKLSNEELQATWLRRVQTTPGDFLRVKFAYQAQTKPDNEQKEVPDAKKEHR